MSDRILGSLTSPEIGGLGHDDTTLIVPLGATEQHGPHLPLDTDTRIATAWARGLADRLRDAVVAPALAYGSSGEHQSFAGTLSIGRDALEVVLIELIRSASNTFATVVILSGHAGNAEPVLAVAQQMNREGHSVRALFPVWDQDTIDFALDAHAGRVETSLMLHIAPESVRLDRAAAGATETLAELMPILRTGGVAAVSANGVLGDPAGARADEGRRLLDDLIDRSALDIVAV